jgi:aminoglycoside phosphotransferase (APT) family kinase protein
MTLSPDPNPFERVLQKMDSRSKLLRAWKLTGGVSAQITALEVEGHNGQIQKLIVRQHGEADRSANPRIAADEFNLLRILEAHGLSAPKPYFVDLSDEIFPTPYIVIEYIEGETVFAPADVDSFIRQVAVTLARIHTVATPNRSSVFLPNIESIYSAKLRQRPALLDDSISEGRMREFLEMASPLQPQNPQVLLHGDYWPGNLLWKDGQLAGVIDWEDAKIGDALSDLGIARLEILWALGANAMLDFTHQYQSLTTLDFTNLPCWDLFAALRPAFKISELAANADAEKTMRERHHWFVTQAFEKMPSR